MKMLLMLILSLLSSQSFARRASVDPDMSSQTRGVFSVGLTYGATNPRLLNTDGSISSFRGSEVGLLLDASALLGAASDFRFFLEAAQSSSHGTQTSDDSMTGTRFLAGMKAFPLSFFYVAAGIGRLQSTLQTASSSATIASPITALGGGIELPISGDIYMGVNLWYRSGVLRANENPSLSGNSFTDTLDTNFVLIWCPASVTNVYKSK